MNNAEKIIREKSSELKEALESVGGYGIILVSHPDMDTALSKGCGRGQDLVDLLASVASENDEFRELLALVVASLLMKGGFASSEVVDNPQGQSNLPS